MNETQSGVGGRPDPPPVELTARSAPPDGQLAYESTVTAPTEWVPYVYTDAELKSLAARRGLSTVSLVVGLLGLVVSIVWVWGGALSLGALALGLIARTVERTARARWGWGIATGLFGLVISAGWLYFIAVLGATPEY